MLWATCIQCDVSLSPNILNLYWVWTYEQSQFSLSTNILDLYLVWCFVVAKYSWLVFSVNLRTTPVLLLSICPNILDLYSMWCLWEIFFLYSTFFQFQCALGIVMCVIFRENFNSVVFKSKYSDFMHDFFEITKNMKMKKNNKNDIYTPSPATPVYVSLLKKQSHIYSTSFLRYEIALSLHSKERNRSLLHLLCANFYGRLVFNVMFCCLQIFLTCIQCEPTNNHNSLFTNILELYSMQCFVVSKYSWLVFSENLRTIPTFSLSLYLSFRKFLTCIQCEENISYSIPTYL